MNHGVYTSCQYLQGVLVFAPRGLHVCCNFSHDEQGWPFICEYNGGELPVERIQKARADIIHRLNTTGDPKCAGCSHLERKKWEQPAQLLTSIIVTHDVTCNLRCNYCYLQVYDKRRETGSPASAVSPQLAEWWVDRRATLGAHYVPYDLHPVLASIINQGQLAPGAAIWWGGGEPALIKNFESSVDLLAQKGFRQEIFTNATLFVPAIYKHLSEANNVGIIVSLDAGTREIYRKVKQNDQFEKVRANLIRYSAGGRHDVTLKFIATEDNAGAEEVAGVLRVLEETGIRKLHVDLDGFNHSPSENVLQTMASLREQAERAGVQAKVFGTGLITLKRLGFEERIAAQSPSGFAQKVRNKMANTLRNIRKIIK